MISIRDATPRDIDRIVDFNARLADETEGKQLELDVLRRGVERALADSMKARYWLADRDGEVAGQIMVTWEWSDWRDGFFWWIQSVYVHPSHRERGVFKSLYQHVKDLSAKESNVCGLRLYVEKENQRAQEVYRRAGMAAAHYEVFEVLTSS